MTSRLRAMTALGLGLLTLVPVAGCGMGGAETAVQAATKPKEVKVTVAPLVRRPVERTVDVVGTLRGWEDVSVGTKRMGRVVKVYHDMGDHVKPGELLMELEAIDADLSIRQAERQLQAELAKLGLKELPGGEFDVSALPSVVKAKVALVRAQQNLARERSLSSRGAGTKQDLQNAENDERSADAAVADAILTARSTLATALATKVALEVARQARVDLEIRAPIPSALPPGVTTPLTYAITRRQAAEGQMLKQGDAVAELVIETPLRLWANVAERYSAEVREGQEVKISVASYPDTAFEGKVARINPSVDAVSRTFQVEVLVPNNRGMLRPGGFAKASIVTKRNAETTVAPLESVIRFAGVTKLFVVEDKKARSINVETGLQGPGWIEVLGKLPARADVVIDGQRQLADGTPVIVRSPEEPKPASEPQASPPPAG